MRNAFESTVLDLPRPMLVQHPHLVQDIHVTVVVVEFTLAATRDAIRILSWLKANAPQSKVIVVANRVPAGNHEISRKDFEASIERKVDLVVPADAKVAAQAAKLGQPFAKVATGAKLGQPFSQLVALVTATVEQGEEAGGAGESAANSLLGKLNLKGLLSKTPAKA
jgi:pilus assembly protein CpaE